MAEQPQRLMALDLGSARTGVAVTDEIGMFAHPRAAITGGEAATIDRVMVLVEEESVSEIVIGLPLTLGGGDSDQTRWVRDMADRIRSRLAIPVTLWDERLTTVEAQRAARGATKTKQTALDSRAAALVLQAVIDARRSATS